MKKVALTLASVLAAAAFAPEASAIPAFARQTGMACSACHQQHYPVLNGFGQSFKSAGYTMMGSQGQVEGEHLSIPNTLNAAILLKSRYQQSSAKNAAADAVSGQTTNSGQWQIPDELSFFMGGRIADTGALKIGFMNENNLVGGPVGGIVAGLKVPIVYDLDSVKIMAIPYLTDALGSAYGFDLSSTGMTRGIRWAEHRKEISAMQYTGMMSGAASGIAFAAVSDMGYINVSKWSPNFAYVPDATGIQMSANLVRIAATPTIAGWAMQIGAASLSGTNLTNPWGTAASCVGETTTTNICTPADPASTAAIDVKGTAVDFQAFGEVGGKDLSIYATYATVPKASHYNQGANDITAMTVGADYSVIPHTLHLGAAYRGATTAAALSDNAITGMAVYDLTQNVAVHVNHSIFSGEAHTADNTQQSMTTFLLELAW